MNKLILELGTFLRIKEIRCQLYSGGHGGFIIAEIPGMGQFIISCKEDLFKVTWGRGGVNKTVNIPLASLKLFLLKSHLKRKGEFERRNLNGKRRFFVCYNDQPNKHSETRK